MGLHGCNPDAWPLVLLCESALQACMAASLQAHPHPTTAKPGAVNSLSLPGEVGSYCSLAGSAQLVLGHNVMLTQTDISG